MGCIAEALGWESARSVGRGMYATAVIADRGDHASVVVVRSCEPLEVGSRFVLDGETWVISRGRSHVRGFVARPLGQ